MMTAFDVLRRAIDRLAADPGQRPELIERLKRALDELSPLRSSSMPAPDTPLRALLKAVQADPDAALVFDTDMTAEEAYNLLDGPGGWEGHPVMDALDRAQAAVAMPPTVPETYLVIRIRRA